MKPSSCYSNVFQTVIREPIENKTLFSSAKCTIFVFLMIVSIIFNPLFAYAKSAPSYQIKAGFIYRFLSFIDFPENTFNEKEDVLRIGVIGDDLIFKELKSVEGRKIKGKTLVIQKIDKQAPANMIIENHVLFISSSIKKSTGAILNLTRKIPILTIGDDAAFLSKGGIIQFVEKNQKVRFEINTDAAEINHILIHSMLKRVAIRIIGESD